MILAELEVYHSRPIAPTRRVALGRALLPVDPPPGFGGILLGGVVAHNVASLDEDLVEDLVALVAQLERGNRVAQPRLRYRLQQDKVGLQRSTHRLHGAGEELWFEFDDDQGEPNQQILGAVYAAGQLVPSLRTPVMAAIRRSIGWTGLVGSDFIATLAGFGSGRGFDLSGLALADPVGWALRVLGLNGRDGVVRLDGGEPDGGGGGGAGGAAASAGAAGGAGVRVPGGAGRSASDGTGRQVTPSRAEIQRRFREALREAHPDHGGESDDAAQRIADLTQARRILLGA